jgi:hypothetical protein
MPEKDAIYIYTGKLPNTDEVVTTTVEIATHPADGNRYGYLFRPPSVRDGRNRPEIVIAPLIEWEGEWSAPRI